MTLPSYPLSTLRQTRRCPVSPYTCWDQNDAISDQLSLGDHHDAAQWSLLLSGITMTIPSDHLSLRRPTRRYPVIFLLSGIIQTLPCNHLSPPRPPRRCPVILSLV
ncbi:hypothetical protein DPMN_145817 [Dreissena polymorpha]|uniref:Uncharacterized protein n=1 Tax=Dreissena polymorpha TaxID=45954 RepID=A0A9D4F5L7_DREPO|nr:hypothetical protein DPMN_145817 [Dreissena polymorpha]